MMNSSTNLYRPKLLILADWYSPGFRAGGPIRSAVHCAEQLEDVLDIYVLTTDRDLGQTEPYSGIQPDCWVGKSSHRVYYSSPDKLSWKHILSIIQGIKPDHIYLNSMFSIYMTIFPLLMFWLGLIDGKILLAPRGMLMDSALAIKPFRKRIFITCLKVMGLHRRICFQATNADEMKDVKKQFGSNAEVVQMANLPMRQKPFRDPPEKQQGILKMVFVGRSHPIKNLEWLLSVLDKVISSIELTIIMTREDEAYAISCRKLADAMAAKHSVRFLEDCPHEQIEGILLANHIFTLPTKGENFGHAIYEALAVGRPVLISDQTPWRHLESSFSGWDLPLGNPALWREKIDEIAAMDHTTLLRWCQGAWDRAESYVSATGLKDVYINQFK